MQANMQTTNAGSTSYAPRASRASTVNICQGCPSVAVRLLRRHSVIYADRASRRCTRLLKASRLQLHAVAEYGSDLSCPEDGYLVLVSNNALSSSSPHVLAKLWLAGSEAMHALSCQGLAHCFEKTDSGTSDVFVIEPVAANSLECMATGMRPARQGRTVLLAWLYLRP